jgi:hypothetical protein
MTTGSAQEDQYGSDAAIAPMEEHFSTDASRARLVYQWP